MKKIILTLACALFAGSLNAAEFQLNGASLVDQVIASAPEVKIPEAPKPAKAKTSSYVQLSGYVSLSGSGWLHGENGGFTSVTLSGWGTFRDSSGRITSNNTHISATASFWVRPNQSVFETVRPSVYVTFYRDGRMVGSTNMTGSITVNGWPSSNYFSLSGSGYLNGSMYVEDAD